MALQHRTLRARQFVSCFFVVLLRKSIPQKTNLQTAAEFSVIAVEVTVPTRKKIKGITAGLSGMVNGRNNDFSGFWGVGYIYNAAFYNNFSLCSFNLLEGTSVPNFSFTNSFTSIYKKYLQNQLARNGLAVNTVSNAEIIFKFNVKTVKLVCNGSGQPYECIVLIQDDLGKTFEHKEIGCVRREPPTPPRDLEIEFRQAKL